MFHLCSVPHGSPTLSTVRSEHLRLTRVALQFPPSVCPLHTLDSIDPLGPFITLYFPQTVPPANVISLSLLTRETQAPLLWTSSVLRVWASGGIVVKRNISADGLRRVAHPCTQVWSQHSLQLGSEPQGTKRLQGGGRWQEAVANSHRQTCGSPSKDVQIS